MDQIVDLFYQDDTHLSDESLVEEVGVLTSPHKESKNATDG